MREDDRYGALLQKIVEHPRYGPAMEDAVQRRVPLVLNFHNHQAGDRYCLAICEKQEGAIELLDIGLGELRELVHIESFSASADECVPLCGELSRALVQHYGLVGAPLIYLDGAPVPATPEAGR